MSDKQVKDFCQQFKDENPKSAVVAKAAEAQVVYKRPKKALTPYLLFAADKRKELPGVQICEQMKQIGKMWNALTTVQKGAYELKAKHDKD